MQVKQSIMLNQSQMSLGNMNKMAFNSDKTVEAGLKEEEDGKTREEYPIEGRTQ